MWHHRMGGCMKRVRVGWVLVLIGGVFAAQVFAASAGPVFDPLAGYGKPTKTTNPYPPPVTMTPCPPTPTESPRCGLGDGQPSTNLPLSLLRFAAQLRSRACASSLGGLAGEPGDCCEWSASGPQEPEAGVGAWSECTPWIRRSRGRLVSS